MLGLLVALGTAAPAAAADSGTVPGSVTAEAVVAFFLVDGTYEFGGQPFATPNAAAAPHRSATLAGLTNCGSGTQDVFVRGTDATGDGAPAASWALDPAVRSAPCKLDSFGLGVSNPGLPAQAVSLLDSAFLSVLPGISVDAAADLYMPCTGSSGGGETMTFSVVYTAVVGESGAPTPTATRSLTVLTGSAGSGTVTSSPSGISCPARCTASFSDGTVVTLAATPAAGSIFLGWSVNGCLGNGKCQSVM